MYSGVGESKTFVDLLPFPVAFWSHNRHSCVFNHYTSQLLGLAENDFSSKDFLSLWTDRIHPQDRVMVETAWRRIENGEPNSSCRYRFFLERQDAEIQMQEYLFSSSGLTRPSEAVWSVYCEDRSTGEEVLERTHVRDLVGGLTHEIGNSLQAIRGEVDFLKLAGTLPQKSADAISLGIEQIRSLAWEANEYLSPFTLDQRWEDSESVINEVIQSRQLQLAQRGIHVSAVFNRPLPALSLGPQFRGAFERVIDFSSTILPEGGALRVEVRPRPINDSQYVELRVVNVSPTQLEVEENEVFRPYIKVNDRRVGLTMSMARQILRRHFGNISFRKEQRNRGVFSILIKTPMDSERITIQHN